MPSIWGLICRASKINIKVKKVKHTTQGQMAELVLNDIKGKIEF